MEMTNQQKRWLMAVGYVLFIYATLGAVVAPLRFLRAHGVLRLTLATFYLATFLVLWRVLMKTQTREAWRYLFLIGMFLAYYFVARKVKIPEEQVHFFEYGLVGVLLARALEVKSGFNWKTFLLALVLAGLIGWFDEILQGHIPSRHYDVHDIFLNILSAVMGLTLYLAFPVGYRMRSSSIQ
jgi:MFS family permease